MAFDFGNANEAQRSAISTIDGPLLIIAGPGTGKTYTLVKRIVYLITEKDVLPEEIMIATFTEKAAKELITRITNELYAIGVFVNLNEMYIGTFHSICLRILKDHLEYTRIKKNYRMLDNFEQQYMVFQKINRFRNLPCFDVIFDKKQGAWRQAGEIVKYVNNLAEELVDIDEMQGDADEHIVAVANIMKQYNTLMEDENLIDFSSIQTEAYKLLIEKPSILEEIQQKIKYVMVDEYQDTNYIQELLVFLIAGKNKNICVVGDDDQGLYRFRGATIRNILEFPGHFAEGECKQVKLVTNYRSERQIIDFYNKWMSTTDGRALLVNKGREGWNCRSLFSVALFRSPKSKVFVLQATMRCLRKITDEQLTATVYLSKENMDILDDELKKNFRTSIEELVVKKDKKRKKVPVRVKEPPRTLRMNRLHYKYSLETKHYDSRLSFGLKEIETENYDATMYVKEGLTTSSVVRESNVNYMVSKLAYTEITLVAEVAKYFPDIRCTEVARILRESEEGIDKILVAVNEHNDIIYDKIVPTIFEALYRVNKEIVKENVDVKLLKRPKEGGYYKFSGNEDLIIMQNSEDSVVVKNKDKSFHADTYVFDSKPELQLFLQLLANEHVKKAYFTGMFTADQTDFYVPYIDPESNRLRKYYPDFLVKMDDGSYLILEVKGDNMIDDPVVKAKGAAAEEVAVESSMKYEMLKGTDIMEGKAKF